MRSSNISFGNNSLISLKNEKFLEKQRIAGKIAAGALKELEGYCKNKTFHSMKVLNDVIESFIIKKGGIPTFKGYKGFPAGVCVSINQQLVHGIPDDTMLDNGDVVSFDLGVTVDGCIADTAVTLVFGPPKSDKHVQLVKATEEALMCGIKAIAPGKRLGCIGNAIYKYAKNKGYGVITQYGGHGIDISQDGIGIPHATPFVANKAELNEGVRICAGMVLAIEPMLTTGPTKTWTDKDGWTVWCEAEMSSHFEHTVFVHCDCVEIITWRENETYLKSNKVYF
jgi:methionyl aminopeptidase